MNTHRRCRGPRKGTLADPERGSYSLRRHRTESLHRQSRPAIRGSCNCRLRTPVDAAQAERSQSAAPYNITTGADPAANGLYTDRAGRPRNRGHGPTYRSVDLFASRRIHFPNIFGIFGASEKTLAIDVGIQAHNLLNAENHLTLGSVLSSPTFGQPLSALPGRAVRVWFSFGT